MREATETGIQRAIKWCLKVANSLALQKVCKIDELHWPKSNRKGVNSDTEINQNIEHKPPILCKKDAIITYFAWNNFWVELELWKDREKRERHQNVQKRSWCLLNLQKNTKSLSVLKTQNAPFKLSEAME